MKNRNIPQDDNHKKISTRVSVKVLRSCSQCKHLGPVGTVVNIVKSSSHTITRITQLSTTRTRVQPQITTSRPLVVACSSSWAMVTWFNTEGTRLSSLQTVELQIRIITRSLSSQWCPNRAKHRKYHSLNQARALSAKSRSARSARANLIMNYQAVATSSWTTLQRSCA